MPLNNPITDTAVSVAAILAAVDTEVGSIKTKTDTIGALVNTGEVPPTLGGILGDVANVSIAARLTNILAEIAEVEGHFHTRARWFGKNGAQANNIWAADALTPYQAISGANTWGVGASDAALVWGTANAMITGQTKFDLDKIMIVASNSTTVWKLRFIYGSGTMQAAIDAFQYTETMVQVASASSRITKEDIRMPRLTVGTDKVWMQAWNGTEDDKTIDFFVGIHGYVV